MAFTPASSVTKTGETSVAKTLQSEETAVMNDLSKLMKETTSPLEKAASTYNAAQLQAIYSSLQKVDGGVTLHTLLTKKDSALSTETKANLEELLASKGLTSTIDFAALTAQLRELPPLDLSVDATPYNDPMPESKSPVEGSATLGDNLTPYNDDDVGGLMCEVL